MAGLSPRVRGNRNLVFDTLAFFGVYPRVWRGEPWVASVWGNGKAVYPRVCGGTISDIADEPYKYGLSPRVRGNR